MTLCYFWLIVFPGFQIYSILYTIYIPKQEIPENYLANRKTKNNTQLQEEWIRRKYVVPVNIMESENNLIVENAIGGKIIICFGIRIAGRAFLPKSIPLTRISSPCLLLEECLGYMCRMVGSHANQSKV